MMDDETIYARDLDGTGSMHVCAKGDPGAMAYVPADRFAKMARLLSAAVNGPWEGHMLEDARDLLGDK